MGEDSRALLPWVQFSRRLRELKIASKLNNYDIAEITGLSVSIARKITNPNEMTGPLRDPAALQAIITRWPDEALAEHIAAMLESVEAFDRAQQERKRGFVAQTLRPCQVPHGSSELTRKRLERNTRITVASEWVGKCVVIPDDRQGVAERTLMDRDSAVNVRFDDGTVKTVLVSSLRLAR